MFTEYRSSEYTSPLGECVAVKFCTIVSYLSLTTAGSSMVWWLVKECFSAMIRPLRLTAPSGECVGVKFSTIVSYLLISTNHHRFKHGVAVSERVFFCNDKTITAYCSIR